MSAAGGLAQVAARLGSLGERANAAAGQGRGHDEHGHNDHHDHSDHHNDRDDHR